MANDELLITARYHNYDEKYLAESCLWKNM